MGESFAKMFVSFNRRKTPLSDNLSISDPSIILVELIPTLSQIHLLTSTLSPVKTITRIPDLLRLSIEVLALSFGGSKNQ